MLKIELTVDDQNLKTALPNNAQIYTSKKKIFIGLYENLSTVFLRTLSKCPKCTWKAQVLFKQISQHFASRENDSHHEILQKHWLGQNKICGSGNPTMALTLKNLFW